MTEDQHDIFIGSMLGDGYLSKVWGNRNSYFEESHSIPQKEYLLWKFEQFEPFCKIPVFASEHKKVGQRIDGVLQHSTEKETKWRLRTATSGVFTLAERQWYLRDEYERYILDHKGWRIKQVPASIRGLSPRTLAVWFCDDGNVSFSSQRIYIATNGFVEKDVIHLIDLLNAQGITCNLTKNTKGQCLIYIGRGGFRKFFDTILPHRPPCSCLDYKFNFEGYRPGKTKTAPAVGVFKYGDKYSPGLRNKYQSYIYINGKNIILGIFDQYEEAVAARAKAVTMKLEGNM